MDKLTDEQIRKIKAKYRSAVRREYFRQQGAIKRLLRMAGAGDPAPASQPAADIARSSGVALPPLAAGSPEADRSAVPASPSAMQAPGADNQFGRKTMGESHGEIKGQNDQLSSPSGAD